MEEQEAAAANQMDWSTEDEVLVSKQEYHCVICKKNSVSTEDKPMGLIVLVQATSVVGHRRRQGHGERGVLPTNDEENYAQRKDDTLSSEFDRRVEEMDRHFDRVSGPAVFVLVFQSLNLQSEKSKNGKRVFYLAVRLSKQYLLLNLLKHLYF